MRKPKKRSPRWAPLEYYKTGLVALASFAAAAAVEITTRTAIAATVAAATTAGSALFARPGNVDGQGTTIQLGAMHGLDGLLRFLGGAHGDEPEAAGAAGHAVHHQVGLENGAVGGKRVLEIVFSGFEGKISYKQLGAHLILLSATNHAFSTLFPTAGFQIITERSSLEDSPCRGKRLAIILTTRR